MKETITVSFVNPPKEGKKLWTIKTKDNRLFGVFPDKKDLFTPQKTYEVEYTSRDFNGRTFHTIQSAAPVASPQSNGSNGDNDRIRWQTCLKVAGDVHSGNAVTPDDIIVFARKLFAADPIIEAAKEMFSAKEVAEAVNTDDAPGDW